jgi:hypothetical protein
MKVALTQVERVVKEEGYVLTLNQDEVRVLLGALGKAKFDDVAHYVQSMFKESVDREQDTLYKLYNTLYDALIPSNRW